MKIAITKSSHLKPKPASDLFGFGQYTTDHMFQMNFEAGRGWYDARIVPYQPLRLDPAALVLHYNQEIFEGLKAYAFQNGDIGLFRPIKNAERLNGSAERRAMPTVDPDLFIEAIKALISIDRDWLPKAKGTSLYIRPTMIATEAVLAVRPAQQYLFYIILGPVGAYYAEGFNPTKIFVSDTYIRAAEGGSGTTKTSGNYGPTLLVSHKTKKMGYTQVLWLDAKEKRYVEEVGTSNIFFLIDTKLITPPLEGTILPGITRNSVIQMAKHWHIQIEERKITIDEVIESCKNGSLKEIFATGTAAVISPVGLFCYKGQSYTVGDGSVGALSKSFYEEIFNIQYGRMEDKFNWMVTV